MSTPLLYLAVALGGALGACLRFGLNEAAAPYETRSILLGLPASTLLINVLGSVLLGVLSALALTPLQKALLGTGVLGGFTTFSAFSVQSVALLQGAPLRGVLYMSLSVLLCVGGAALGIWAASAFGRGESS